MNQSSTTADSSIYNIIYIYISPLIISQGYTVISLWGIAPIFLMWKPKLREVQCYLPRVNRIGSGVTPGCWLGGMVSAPLSSLVAGPRCWGVRTGRSWGASPRPGLPLT